MTNTNPRETVWTEVLGQIEALQVRMQELGVQRVEADYLNEDESAGLQDVAFIDGCLNRVSLQNESFGPGPDMVVIGRTAEGVESLYRHPYSQDGSISTMTHAAEQIFEEVADFIMCTCEPGTVIDAMKLKIHTGGGLEVEIVNDKVESWIAPAITETPKQLLEWFQRESERLNDTLSERLEAVAINLVTEMNEAWPGYNFSLMEGMGSTYLWADDGSGGRLRIDRMHGDEVEAIWPGLYDKLFYFEDMVGKLDTRLGAVGFPEVFGRPGAPEAEQEMEPGI
ncbi:hypothetical protein [Pseudosulfitobacter pseudonitzschiae]|uniref:hypothetical protein n=1 Tax=Pseudosulfitobacter pseudonitzschiae TaxID=1402135 RepID=UPI003B77BD8B